MRDAAHKREYDRAYRLANRERERERRRKFDRSPHRQARLRAYKNTPAGIISDARHHLRDSAKRRGKG